MPIAEERKELLSGTVFELVVHPLEVRISRDPETNTGSISYQWQQHLAIDGNVRRKEYAKTGSVSRNLDQVGSVYPAYAGETDPHSGADLTQISMDGVVKILLSAFDKAYVQDVT